MNDSNLIVALPKPKVHEQSLAPFPSACCVPSKLRLAQLEASRDASASRPRATSGSLENMVRLEGSFRMGSETPDAFPTDGEGPGRQITLSAFYMSKFAVTNQQFAEFTHQTDIAPKPSVSAGRSSSAITCPHRCEQPRCPARPGGCASTARIGHTLKARTARLATDPTIPWYTSPALPRLQGSPMGAPLRAQADQVGHLSKQRGNVLRIDRNLLLIA